MRPSLFRHCGTHCHGPCKAPPRVSQPWTARVAASNETGVVEVKAHGPAAGLHGVISQVHGQADEVAFDENAVISVADGPETVIRRRDVLSRDCLSDSCRLVARKEHEKTFLPWACKDVVERDGWRRTLFP